MSESFESEPKPEPKKPEISDIKPEIEKKDKLKTKLIIGALAISMAFTLMFSGGANIAKKMAERAQTTKTEYESKNSNTTNLGAEVDIFDVLPGENTLKLLGVEVAATTTEADTTSEESTSYELKVPMKWARLFEVDPRAIDPRGPEAIVDAAKQVEELQTKGWDIDKIKVQGFSSDEGDDRKGHNPGLGLETNEKNIKLADKRAGAVSDLFIEELEKTLGVSKAAEIRETIEQIGGEEVRDDGLEARIDAMAKNLNMPMDDMVMQFNRDPDSLPLEAQELLSELYGDRFVRIEIEASKDVITPGEQETKSLIIIPVLIPILRRRKKPGDAPTPIPPVIIGDPWPPTGDPPPPIPPPPTGEDTRQFNLRGQFGKSHEKTSSGYQQITQRIKQPGTHNFSQGKGSGSRHSAYRNTTRRGNSR